MNQRHFKTACAAALTFVAGVATAGQFDSVFDAMLIPTSAAHTNNDWAATMKIKGVRWDWPHTASGQHDHTMVGRTASGTDIEVAGSRSMIHAVAISVENEGADIRAFGPGPARIKTTCDTDGGTYAVSFYRLSRAGFKPLFISHEFSQGAGGTSSDTFIVAYAIEDASAAVGDSCKEKR